MDIARTLDSEIETEIRPRCHGLLNLTQFGLTYVALHNACHDLESANATWPSTRSIRAFPIGDFVVIRIY